MSIIKLIFWLEVEEILREKCRLANCQLCHHSTNQLTETGCRKNELFDRFANGVEKVDLLLSTSEI